MNKRLIGPGTAALLVVASMVGAGAFTTTGMLLGDVGSSVAVLLAWLVGGAIALFGALAYAELVAALPRNGGEYQLLSRIYHPKVGFVAGWISLVVGFSAPVAASALAFGDYLQAAAPGVSPGLAGLALIVALSVVHGARVSIGGGVQNLLTLAKVAVVLAFIVGGLWQGDVRGVFSGVSAGEVVSDVLSPGFAVGLIFVSFAYSGWNGAAYLAGEVRAPARSLPRALAGGTALVLLLYMGLNVVFLSAGSREELAGVVEVGHVAAVNLFGPGVGGMLSGVIALLLVSSVSAMIMTGPRVYQAIGEDYERLSFLRARRGEGQGPVPAVLLQALVAVVMLLTSSFDALLTYIGFTLSLSAGLTVYGVIHLRSREPELARPYRAWGYPWTPWLFIALSAWMIVYTLVARPVVALAGVVTIASGALLHSVVQRRSNGAPWPAAARESHASERDPGAEQVG